MCFSVMAVSAFAAELETDVLVFDNNETVVYQDDEVTITRVDDIQSSSISTLANTMTYESTWLKHSASGSFTVNTPNSGTIGITLKVESSSNSSFAYISVFSIVFVFLLMF